MKIVCIEHRCWSPVACGGFGYCRTRNQDGTPMCEAKVQRLRAENDAEVKKINQRGKSR